MTSRLGASDTPADIQLRESLDQQPQRSFVMVAGAGSGKTTSLVKALDYLARTQGRRLKGRNQKIACITYTDVAVRELLSDIGNANLFHISTIHSFIWTIIQPFHNDLRDWVGERLRKKIEEAEAKIAKPRTHERTKLQAVSDIARYQRQQILINDIPSFKYGTGSDYRRGILGHSDILSIGPWLIENRPLLRSLVANRFPYVFVDESQDTDPSLIQALRQVADTIGNDFCLGFFGDPMQKIYAGGTGVIEGRPGWSNITKPENFRCPTRVLNVVNRIRAEDDGLQQIRGRTIQVDGVQTSVEGTAKLFILPADARRSERLTDVRQWLAETNNDPLWNNQDPGGDVRTLVLVHRTAARRLGFENIYAALNDNDSEGLKEGLKDGSAWVLRPWLIYLLPIIIAFRDGADFIVISILRKYCPMLSPEDLAGKDLSALMAQLTLDISRLSDMLSFGSTNTVREVLQYVRDQDLYALDERFDRHFPADRLGESEDEADDAAVKAYLDCPATEMWGYRTYVEGESPFATQHGVKGAEFKRVLVILDDEESNYNLYSYGKYLNLTPLSDKDQENVNAGVDSVISRTRRLFYVCCSRATQDLAVVLFVQDVAQAVAALTARNFFDPGDVHAMP
jgi:DNA helicase-2/ATP-dependent DNA helicase PcrA